MSFAQLLESGRPGTNILWSCCHRRVSTIPHTDTSNECPGDCGNWRIRSAAWSWVLTAKTTRTAFLSPIWMWYAVIMGSFSLIWSLLVQQGSGSPLPEYYSILQQIRVPPISWKKNAMTNICFECGISIYWHIGLASRALVQNESWTCCHRAVCMKEVEVDCHTSPLFGCCKETYFRDRRKLPCCSTMLELIHCDPCLRGCSATDVPQPCLPQLIAFYFWEFAPLHRLFVQKGGLP